MDRYSEKIFDFENKFNNFKIATTDPQTAKLGSIFCQLSIIQSRREISAIIVTDDYIYYKEPINPYKFFLL